jgi:hypothetical protein
VVLYGRDGRIVGAVANKRPRQLMGVRKLMSAGASFDDAIAQNA